MKKEVDGVVEAKSILTSLKVKKERVTELSIIMRMIDNKPYYEIRYRNVGENGYNIGYSSYNLKTVLGFIDEYFEIVESDKKTNADRIRNMSDEELAFVIEKIKMCGGLIRTETTSAECNGCKDGYCCNVMQWLQSEAE